jgi:hypothetical protein
MSRRKGGLLIVAVLVAGIFIGQFSVDSAVSFAGYRLGVGSEGYALQRTSDWSIVATGWFPWHHPLSTRIENN